MKRVYETVVEALDRNNKNRPNKTAIKIHKRSSKQKITFGQLWNGSHNVARTLKKEGIGPNSKVAVFSENSIECAVSFFALRRLGATISPIDTSHSGKEITNQLQDFNPDLVLYEEDDTDPSSNQKEALSESDYESKSIKEIVTGPEGEIKTNKPSEEEPINAPAQNDSDTAVITYTSGTTGKPKGVPLTIANLASNVIDLRYLMSLSENDIIGHIAPWYHTMGLNLLLMLPMRIGATNLYLDKYAATNLFGEIAENKVTIFLGVPLLYEKIIAKFERAAEMAYSIPRSFSDFRKNRKEKQNSIGSDLWNLIKNFGQAVLETSGFNAVKKSWKWRHPLGSIPKASKSIKKHISTMIFGLLYPRFKGIAGKLLRKKLGDQFRFFASGSAPLPPRTHNIFAALGLEILNGYGMSEHSPLITMPQEGKSTSDSVGRPLPSVSIIIVRRDEETEKLQGIAQPHEEGEILLSSDDPSLFPGYYNQDSHEGFVEIGGKKYFRTGDIGYLDQEGKLYLSGRKGNRIVPASGQRFSAEDIEKEISLSLTKSQLVENFFIRGNYNEIKRGEEVQIVIEPRFKSLIKEKITTYNTLKKKLTSTWKEASQNLSQTKQPKSMVIVGEMPLTGNMDIKRNALEENINKIKIKDDKSYLKFLVLKTDYSEEEINHKKKQKVLSN